MPAEMSETLKRALGMAETMQQLAEEGFEELQNLALAQIKGQVPPESERRAACDLLTFAAAHLLATHLVSIGANERGKELSFRLCVRDQMDVLQKAVAHNVRSQQLGEGRA